MRYIAIFDRTGRPTRLYRLNGDLAHVLTGAGWELDAAALVLFAHPDHEGVELDEDDARLVALILDAPGLIPVAA